MIKVIGVIGAGQMGSGIAHVCALKGYEVRMSDIDQPALDRAKDGIGRNIARQVAKGKVAQAEMDAALKRIQTGTEYKLFADCDFVVEAAAEKEEVKRAI